MQKRLWKLFQEDRERKIPIRWIIIKARQLGCTTWISGLIYWLLTMNYNKKALCISYDEPSAIEICQKYQSYYLRSQKELAPKVRLMNRRMIHFATPLKDSSISGIGLNSKLFSSSADSAALGRSYTFHYVHASEYAIWDAVGIDVENKLVGLNESVPKIPDSIIIKETTAQGQNIAYDEWIDAFDTQRKIFISWLADDFYRVDLPYTDYFELSELPDSRYGDELKERENIIHELKFWYDEESKNPIWLEHEVMCRLAWRRTKIDDLKGNKWKFKSEYPTTPDDAFNTTSKSIFDSERLAEMRDYVNRNKIVSRTYRYQHDEDVKDFRRKFYYAKYGHLRVFELPEEGARYVIGADGAQGIEHTFVNKGGSTKTVRGDDSSAVVLKLPHLEEVASFNDVVSPTNFAGILNYLGLLYNTGLVIVERNDKGGYAALEILLNIYCYPNLYYAIDPFKSRLPTDIKYGHVTNDITRPIMIRDLMDLVNNNQIQIRSKELIDQMQTFVQLPDGKIAAAPGKHDDLVIALAVAIQGAKQIHIPRESPRPEKAPRYSLDWWANQRTNIRVSNARKVRGF